MKILAKLINGIRAVIDWCFPLVDNETKYNRDIRSKWDKRYREDDV